MCQMLLWDGTVIHNVAGWSEYCIFTYHINSVSLSFKFFIFSQKFNEAAEDIKTLTARPTDDELKEIYALFKQATVGDVNVG